MGFDFAKFFLKQILNDNSMLLNDIEELDLELGNSLQWFLANNVEN